MAAQLFLSHSHEDQPIAEILAELVSRATLKQLEVWYSSDKSAEGGMAPGRIWLEEIRKRLSQSNAVVPLLTRNSLSKPWLVFETGFGAAAEHCEVIPVCVGVSKDHDLPFPIGMYQAFELETYDSLRAFLSKLLAKYDISFDEELIRPILRQAASRFGDFASQMSVDASIRYDVFLACPMAGFDNEKLYQAHRLKVLEVRRTIQEDCNATVYFPAGDFESTSEFEPSYVSSKKEMEALERSRTFVMIYPAKIVSSVLFQAGLAMGYRKISVHFADPKNLPFLMQSLSQLPRTFPQVRMYTASSIDDVIRILKKEGPEFFSW